MDGDDNVVAMSRERLVNRVVDHLENQMVQAGAIGRVTDVHARPLANRFQAFKNLNRCSSIFSV